MINDFEEEVLEMIVTATRNNEIVLVETLDKRTNKRVAVVCRVISPNEKCDQYRIYPLAVVIPSTDFQLYEDPTKVAKHDTASN